jgi:transcription initiation factor TFIID TATA-box-binding protein
MSTEPTIKIENVVATSTIGSELNLRAITLALDGAEYEPEQFPGIVYRIKDPKTATLIFRSGKIVCTGAKSVADVKRAIKNVVERLTEAGFEVHKNPEVVVQNIVATTDLKKVLNLNTIAISLGLENVEYEPEQFPGLVYRIEDPKIVALLFGSGKVVCTGAKKKEDLTLAVKKIQTELSNAGLL